MEKKNIWFITAKTNLHVGDENTSSYGLIDKAVQRDALTGLPCINSSSLKGALNEYCCNGNKGKEFLNSETRIKIFGSDKTGTNKDAKKGSYIFFDAKILFLPVQNDDTLFHWATSKGVLDRFRKQMKLFGIELNEDNNSLIKELKTTLGLKNRIDVKKSDKEFEELCSDNNLPIIARNYLENGMSSNLWYEQILPAETVFYTIIDDKKDGKLFEKLGKQDSFVQIGANATIGYGYCKFKTFKENSNEQNQ
ncbi:MAG: type III-B CRISPR module RAMP protein Cmr4 [Ignavibacteria bacterium]|jgi:CRISPR-associated protein Cmr4|nr:type III-B CRISPR module RAMP protein Cmr4 [Ignavibacteria bacterium]